MKPETLARVQVYKEPIDFKVPLHALSLPFPAHAACRMSFSSSNRFRQKYRVGLSSQCHFCACALRMLVDMV